MLVPINLTGGDYQHKSRPLTCQVTRNFWPQVLGTQKAKSPYVLQSFYGLKLWKEQAGTVDRGMLNNQGKLYKITDNILYVVARDGTHTALGYIAGSNRCIMWSMGAQVIIANGDGLVYTYDGTTLSQNTNVNLGLPRSVTVLNNQAVYDDGIGQGFDVSDVGKPDSIFGINNAQAESDSDMLRRVYAYRETLYLMGDKTIEPWYNSGQGNPPFDKITGAVISVGLGALHSVADNPDYMFLLGTDYQVHSFTGGTASADTIVSTPAMYKQFEQYTTIEDAIGWTMQLEGQWFYALTFPAQDITWVYPVGGEWFQWGSSNTGRIRANSYINIFGKKLVADSKSGNIYELDAETYTDANEPIVRTRITAPIHGGLFKQDGKDFEINSLEIILETGIGIMSGQGVDPIIMIAFSKDGGKTFGTERFLKVGRLNDTRKKVRLANVGRFNECTMRLRVSDPVYWCIHSAVADVEVCI